MLTDEECRRCAEGLLDAARTGTPITALGHTFPGLTIADAYRIQRWWLQARCAAGARAIGYKVGLTSAATQALFGAAEPITARIVPAFEIVAQRTEASRALADAIADNGAHGAIVLGSDGISPAEADIAAISATLFRSRERVESGIASSVMGHPAAAVAWLARALHAAGERLERSQIILTGTLTRAVEVVAGDVYRAEYVVSAREPAALGALEVSFG
ncbi:MAG TPA: hypothetical protein VGI35_06205 [Steroidobacteraceae bacterium]